jgi:hypothetical protein
MLHEVFLPPAVCPQQVAGDDPMAGTAMMLQKFHDWVIKGGAGPTWELEKENYEGWRVVIDEGEVLASLPPGSWSSAGMEAWYAALRVLPWLESTSA